MSDAKPTVELMVRRGNTSGTDGMMVSTFGELKEFAAMIVQGGMTNDVRSVAQALMIASFCKSTGKNYFEFNEEYHMVGGRPSKRADSILASFEELGGNYTVDARTASEAQLTLTIKGRSYVSRITWEDALGEPFVYNCKEADAVEILASGAKPKLKTKYATPRARMQMLWSRAVSDGVRTICPGAVKGIYTPEEVGDFDETPPRKTGPLTSEEVNKRVEASKPVVTVVEQIPVEVIDPAQFCPIAGECMGVTWASMTTEILQEAMNTEMAEVTAEHKAAIAAIIAGRGEVVK